jgi:lipoate-protein ligase A
LHTFAPHVTWDEIALAFRAGFSVALQADFQPSELTNEEWELALRLADEKYSKLTWLAERVKLLEDVPGR